MKKHLVAFALLILPVFVFAVTKQAKQEGASQINVPNTADVDALTIDQDDGGQLAIRISSGGVLPWLLPIAQINSLTPATTGQLIACSDCTMSGVCQSTGILRGAFAVMQATATETGVTRAHCK
jgi:hypothetical protein